MCIRDRTSNGQDPREPDAQRVHVDGEWSEVVDRNTQIQMVSCTADSDYGRVLHIHFRNQNQMCIRDRGYGKAEEIWKGRIQRVYGYQEKDRAA